MNGYLAICKEGSKNIILDVNEYLNMTGVEIKKRLSIDSLLFYRSIYTEIQIEDNEIPLRRHAYLTLKTKCTPFQRPEHYLSIRPNSYEGKIILHIPVIATNYEGMPPISVVIPVKFFDDHLWEDFLEIIKSSLEFETSSCIVKLGSRVPQPNQTLKYIIKYITRSPVKIECTLTEKAINKCQHRIQIINEIISTEQTYINSLHQLIEFWEPNLSSILDNMENSLIFGQIPLMINCHESFLQQLQKREIKFDTMVSDIFFEFSDFFKISSSYIASYTKIRSLIQNKMNSHQKLFEDLTLKNQPIFNLLITPVQRVPRYILFIKELLKFTPKFHPDQDFLGVCGSKFDTVTREIEKTQSDTELLDAASKLQETLVSFNVLNVGRRLLKFCDITINKPKKSQGVFYLFNDIVIITEIDPKKLKETLLLSLHISDFIYNIGDPDRNSISFLDSYENKQSIFGDSRNMFNITFKAGELCEVDETFFYLTQISSETVGEWRSVMADFPDSLLCYGSSTGAVGNNIYVFGGHNTDKTINTFCKFNIETKKFECVATDTTKPKKRWGHCSAQAHNGFYIIGGCSSSQFLSDVWQYDSSTNQWCEVILKTSLEGAMGRSCVFWNNHLILFGGRLKKGTSNAVTLIDLENGDVFKSQIDGGPDPRYFHTASVYRDGMYVAGGRDDNQIFNDIYRLDLKMLKWEKVPTEISERFAHASVVYGRFLYLIGGVNGKGNFTERVDLSDPTDCEHVLDSGIVPRNLFYHTASIVDGVVYIFGGSEIERKFVIPGVRTLKLPECYDKGKNFDVSARPRAGSRQSLSAMMNIRKITFSKISNLASSLLESDTSSDDELMQLITKAPKAYNLQSRIENSFAPSVFQINQNSDIEVEPEINVEEEKRPHPKLKRTRSRKNAGL